MNRPVVSDLLQVWVDAISLRKRDADTAIHYGYDPATGRQTRVWTGIDPNSPVTDIRYGYDRQGRLASVAQIKANGVTPAAPAGAFQYAGYDARGNPTNVFGNVPITLYGYDAVGDLAVTKLPDGVNTSYLYDDLNRLTEEKVVKLSGSPAPDTYIADYQYHVKSDGQRDWVKETTTFDSSGNPTGQIETDWSYDLWDRLTEEKHDVAGQSDYYDTHYTYDLANNRAMQTTDQYSSTAPGNSIHEEIDYTYNPNDQLLTEQTNNAVTDPSLQYSIQYGHTSGSTFVPGYDANGSLTERHATYTGKTEDDVYTWDLRGRMTQASVTVTPSGGSPTTTITNYGYDSDGVRVSQTTGANTTYFLNDPSNPTGYAKAIEEASTPGGTPTRSYVFGLDVLAQNDQQNGTVYLIHDGHGSTRMLMTTAGAAVSGASYRYDAFGAALGFDPNAAETPWLFGGDGLYDPVSGWMYQLARWRSGFRFASMDDPKFSDGSENLDDANLYVYAGEDSINLNDPSGNAAVTNARLGTAVHSFLNRAFEGFTVITPGFPALGGTPGPRLPIGPGTNASFPGVDRWSNRRISSIAAKYGSPGSINPFRPDFVEATGSTSGDLYELKPISALDLVTGTSIVMAADLLFYSRGLNASVPKISWSLGRSWAPGFTEWPTFTSPLMPAGDTLVTISDYAVMPGAIFYDIVGIGDVAELAAAAASGIETVAAESVTLGGIEAAAGMAAEAAPAVAGFIGPELDADLAIRFELDTALAA